MPSPWCRRPRCCSAPDTTSFPTAGCSWPVVTSATCTASPTRTCSIPPAPRGRRDRTRSEEHTSELQSLAYLVCRLLLEKKKISTQYANRIASLYHTASTHYEPGRRNR